MSNLFTIPSKPRVGDIVMVKQGIGVVRYVGEVEFDKDNIYYGIEVKGPPVIGGHNGSYGQTQYFQTSNPQRGIFCKNVIRYINSKFIYLFSLFIVFFMFSFHCCLLSYNHRHYSTQFRNTIQSAKNVNFFTDFSIFASNLTQFNPI